ncbi:DUF305 domain-containing protein [Vitiosangium sp. GDMCC 1.1324]|uniref:CopM family metallochaperone n=1 Tax=Vitiosangium sp. (strain GDMCC 1.1324) TaxID=2138576 RepID=UPI000D3C826B|nr:DUF305 domain-containing protein [Vitiosangium sp. GDMCC 1.1324]PTL74912.1 hypothetical protein DAT35_57820 [Vitiosangium sp. GDMCC 1.1324]
MKDELRVRHTTRFRRICRWTGPCILSFLFLTCAHPPGRATQHTDAHAAYVPEPAAPESFRSLMDDAMVRMHKGMNIPYTGDPDRDFAAMMIPHHQGAIDMAVIQLRYGKDERLRRLAQEIIIEQREEIAVMQRILQELPSPPGVPPSVSTHSHEEH